jgi:hypothetical protein
VPVAAEQEGEPAERLGPGDDVVTEIALGGFVHSGSSRHAGSPVRHSF